MLAATISRPTGGSGMSSSNVKTVANVHQAFNDRDWGTMSSAIAPDCVFTDGRGVRHEGPDGFTQGYSKAWADAFSDGRITDTVYHDAGDSVVAEFVGRGTNDGSLGPMPASGRSVVLPYCEIYDFDADGKVASGRAYFDQLGMLVQLGLAEAPPS
jgi:steroid delta-isomerase-like uncharacterized protein